MTDVDLQKRLSRFYDESHPRKRTCRPVDEISRLRSENARLRVALEAVVKWADELRYFSDEGSKLAPVFQQAKDALGAQG